MTPTKIKTISARLTSPPATRRHGDFFLLAGGDPESLVLAAAEFTTTTPSHRSFQKTCRRSAALHAHQFSEFPACITAGPEASPLMDEFEGQFTEIDGVARSFSAIQVGGSATGLSLVDPP